jgi:hypothetical protein
MKDVPFVRQVESVKSLTEQAKALVGEILKVERLTLEKAHRLGGILGKLRARCARGEWLPTLFKLGVSKASAHEYIAIAKLPLTDVLSSGSIRDALCRNKIAGEEQEVASQAATDEAITERDDEKTGGQESETSVRTPPTREPGEDDMGARIEAELCKRCKRIGAPSCDRCRVKAYRIQNAIPDNPQVDAKKRRKLDQKNGVPVFRWPEFHTHFGHVARSINQFGNAYGVSKTDEWNTLHRDLEAWHKRFRAWTETVSGEKAPEIR